MAEAMDATTLETISLLEARLLRIEHVLYGAAASPPPSSERDPATTSLENLERRFAALISRIRPYGELMKLCTSSSPISIRVFVRRRGTQPAARRL